MIDAAFSRISLWFRMTAAAVLAIGFTSIAAAQSAAPFNPDANSTVLAVVTQPDEKMLVGGAFTQIGGAARDRLARFTAEGKLDPDFAALAIDGGVQAIALQSDGRILIAGNFVQVGGLVRNHLARLMSDGSVDTSYAPNVNGVVYDIALRSNG